MGVTPWEKMYQDFKRTRATIARSLKYALRDFFEHAGQEKLYCPHANRKGIEVRHFFLPGDDIKIHEKGLIIPKTILN